MEPQRDCDAPVAYGALEVSVISRRTRSLYLCVVVGLVVLVWCVCGVCVCRVVRACVYEGACMYEQMLQLYPDERHKKKIVLHHYYLAT